MKKAIIVILVVLMTVSSCTVLNSEISNETTSMDKTTTKAPNTTEKESTDDPAAVSPVFDKVTVIIDPGHGFDDPGSQPDFLGCDEAEITLKAALMLQETLSNLGIGVILTHNGESFPSYDNLCASAERYGIDYDISKMSDNNIFSPYERAVYENILEAKFGNCMFISLHTNSYPDDSSVSGLSIDYYEGNPSSDELARFCADFKSRIENKLNKKVTVFKDDYNMAFIVTKYTEVPSVLIEMGYGTNPNDASDLRSDDWMSEFISALSDCIVQHIKENY